MFIIKATSSSLVPIRMKLMMPWRLTRAWSRPSGAARSPPSRWVSQPLRIMRSATARTCATVTSHSNQWPTVAATSPGSTGFSSRKIRMNIASSKTDMRISHGPSPPLLPHLVARRTTIIILNFLLDLGHCLHLVGEFSGVGELGVDLGEIHLREVEALELLDGETLALRVLGLAPRLVQLGAALFLEDARELAAKAAIGVARSDADAEHLVRTIVANLVAQPLRGPP